VSTSGEYSKSVAAPFQTEEQPPIRVSEVISALSYALGMTEGQPFGHSLRSCVFTMHIAEEIGLSRQAKSDLYYAALLKDAGCSSNASRLFQILGTDDIQAKRDVIY
jgi:HD-GYP domain-containing protein (c-di-GMP phosphodiesterase class II)